MYKPIDLSIFPKERKIKLQKIKRYSMFEFMMYRSNLWSHTLRVFWLVEELLPLAEKYLKLDPEKARTLALVHDDAEMIIGDIQAGHKARMTSQRLKQIERKEEKAIVKLSKTYPKEINGYSYKDLLLHAARKDCIEAQLVSYIDKLDAYCESIHEVLAGNMSFFGTIPFYVDILTLFPQKYPDLAPLLKSKESPLTYIKDRVNPFYIAKTVHAVFGKPFTQKTLNVESNMPFYNTWRRIVLERGGDEGKRWLLEQKEFKK